jgi:hypothetical protein
MNNPATNPRLEKLLRESGESSFAPGFSHRVLARLQAQAERPEAELFSLWTVRLFPRVAAVAVLLLVAVAAWNLGTTRHAGGWMDRLLSLPAATLDNSLSLSQMEDWS